MNAQDLHASAGMTPDDEPGKAVEDLDEAIATYRAAASALSDASLERVGVLRGLGAALTARFELTGAGADLDEAISVQREAICIPVARTSEYVATEAAVSAELAANLRVRFMRTGSRVDLDEAIGAFEAAWVAMPDDHRGRLGAEAAVLFDLAGGLRARFALTSDLQDLNRAVETYRSALLATPARSSEHAVASLALGEVLQWRYEVAGEFGDLEEAIAIYRDASGGGTLEHAAVLDSLCDALHARFEVTGSLAHLDQAIAAYEGALTATPTSEYRPLHMHMLGNALSARFKVTGAGSDLENAIAVLEDAAAITPDDAASVALLLTDLGRALYWRFERSAELGDLDRAIEAYRGAKGAMPDDVQVRLTILSGLAEALLDRFEQIGQLVDIDEAIDVYQVATDTAELPFERGMLLSDLGNALLWRFEQVEALTDLHGAVEAHQAAAAAIPHDAEVRATVLLRLAAALRTRFTRDGGAADLDAAIIAARAAVAATPTGASDRLRPLSELASVAVLRFRRTHELADVDEAISAYIAAVGAAPDGSKERASLLFSLGSAFQSRFEQSTDLGDLDQAATAFSGAIQDAPEGDPDRHTMLSALGGVLDLRHGRTGLISDLQSAVAYQWAAVDAAPADSSDRAEIQGNLGGALHSLYQRSGLLADLDEAISAYSVAAAGAPDRPMLMSGRGVALRTRFSRTGRLSDLDDAIAASQAAVDALPPDAADRFLALSGLGSVLQARFERSGQAADLDKAVATFELATAVTSEDDPQRALILSAVGALRRTRFDRTGETTDLEGALIAFREAMEQSGAWSHARLQAAFGYASAAVAGGRWGEAIAGYEVAIELIAQLAPRWLSRPEREYLLQDIVGLASAAAVCCARAGRPDRAVELFEQGRGVLLGQMLDTRTDLTALREEHPDLAARFEAIRDELDEADAGEAAVSAAQLEWASGGQAARTRRREAATNLDALLNDVRRLPGFSGFLRPPSIEALSLAAAEGPIVIVAVSAFGSVALALTRDGVQPVPLRKATPEEVSQRAQAYLQAIDSLTDTDATPAEIGYAERQLQAVLRWLWLAIAGPTFESLGLSSTPAPGEEWPRLWWCLSGPLALMPLHAAGLGIPKGVPSAEPKVSALDRVVTSYTPTIRALAHARSGRHRRTDTVEGPVLAVAMSTTPGQRGLPGADRELAAIIELFGEDQVETLVSTTKSVSSPKASPRAIAATRDAVLDALPRTRIAHFACHATSDVADPWASRLLLLDQPLAVADIIQLRLTDARLAFLSACSTARPGGLLLDEAIHLSSAFQLAGYRHVIGTLWPVNDTVAAEVARDVYKLVAGTSGGPIELSGPKASPAHALHTVIRQLREQDHQASHHWAAHIHLGP